MDFLIQWFMVFLLVLVAAISPGPDFVITVRNSLAYSRKTGLLTALGLALGICIHVTYCIAGVAALIAHSILLFNIIKYIGAGYLVYVGIKALRSHGLTAQKNETIETRPDISWKKALASGFVVNILNPKATMFYFALFTQVLGPETPLAHQLIYGITCIVTVSGWFAIVALILTDERIRNIFLSFSKWIDRVCGGAMIAFGIKLAFTKTHA